MTGVQAFQSGVGARADAHLGMQFTRALDPIDAQAAMIEPVLVRGQDASVERDVDQLQILAIQAQGLQRLAGIGHQ